MLVETEGRNKIGVVVDELLGLQQVVIKSLEVNYDAVAGVSGATILGNGRVALILDPDGLAAVGQGNRGSDGVRRQLPANVDASVAERSPDVSAPAEPEIQSN